MLRSSKAAMDNELKQVSQRPPNKGNSIQPSQKSSNSGSTNPNPSTATTTTFLSSGAEAVSGVTGNKIYATLNKTSKKISHNQQPNSNSPSQGGKKPEPPTRDLSCSAISSATPLTHVAMAQGSFPPQGHVHLTSADLLVHPQPPSCHQHQHHDSTLATVGSGGSVIVSGPGASSLYGPSSSSVSGGGIVEAPEEWVLHTSCQGESNELLRECCIQSESRSDDSYPVHHSPSRNNANTAMDSYHNHHHQQGQLLPGGGHPSASHVERSMGNPNSSSMIFNIMTDPPSLSSPINPSHIAKAICPPPPSDSELATLSHQHHLHHQPPWSSAESHHSPSQVSHYL